MSSLSIIVATDIKRGIGIDNKLPWHLPADLAHFKRTTSGHPIIMGRKTFESIGRPLPQRRNIVVTRNPEWQHQGVETAPSLEAARSMLTEEMGFIIGGAEIYQQSMAVADQLIVTEIQQEFACDAFFPVINPLIWIETAREEHYSEENNLHFAFVTYKKN
ncbi:dihydrofolate reductase [Undibacterium sp. TS12]|uniref:dihydrofolate reductase n=1 Tax=Undibacterium sp. TS12 TaxID=2908202 RepID=UPI001F4D14AB|nr:dihydrofolate reductase [Undibacterium sp. TS12]MCH8618392.1 dihydrofolate reductase [Undibacterium sp. TS12]